MTDIASRRERLTVFLAVGAWWALAYFGTGVLNAGRRAASLPWDPVTALPVASVFVIPYLSAYLMPFMSLALLRGRKAFRALAAAAALVIAACAAAFLLAPLVIYRPPVADASVFGRLLAWLYASDRPGNLFPSLHVALSFLFALGAGHARPRLRPWMLGWAALVAVSTLLTRQHYLVDVLGGIIVAWVAWKIFLRLAK